MGKLSWLAALAVMCAPCNAIAKDPVEALATTLGVDALKSRTD